MNIELKENTNYGIMLSGGLDSAILLCLIIKNFVDKKIPINLQPFSIPKNDNSYHRVKNILTYVNDNLHITLPDTIYVGDISVHHGSQGTSAVNDIKTNYPYINYIFFGSNKNPPIELPGTAPIRIFPKGKSMVISPFENLYKTDIVSLIEKHNHRELYKLTHTCTELQDSRCNQCWQCNERSWAFNELNLIDTGEQ